MTLNWLSHLGCNHYIFASGINSVTLHMIGDFVPNSAGGKEHQHFYFYFVGSPGAEAWHVKRCNALVSSVILHQTQQEVKNFNNLIFNSSNGPGYMPGM